jgi:NADH-quinone oxidoreductase subunit K
VTAFVSGALPLLAAVPLQKAALLAAVLFAIGIAGITCRRNILVMLLSVEIMLNAANLALVVFSRVHGDVTGQVFVFFAMVVAAAEVAVGLAIVIAVYRLRRSTDVGETTELRDMDQGPVTYPQLEGEDAHVHAHEHAGSHADGHPAAHGAPHVPDAPSEHAHAPVGAGGPR